MSFKKKKCSSENEWLTKKLHKVEFFFLAQLKPCHSSDWTLAQKEFQKFGLKIKLVSFKSLHDASFFSELDFRYMKALFEGQLVLIYSDIEVKPSSSLINFVKSVDSVRPFLFYHSGRLINVNSSDVVKEIESFSFLGWTEVLNHSNGFILCNTLNTFVNSCPELLQSQHKMLLDILIYNQIKNDDKSKF